VKECGVDPFALVLFSVNTGGLLSNCKLIVAPQTFVKRKSECRDLLIIEHRADQLQPTGGLHDSLRTRRRPHGAGAGGGSLSLPEGRN
jgi:hypothetical protein